MALIAILASPIMPKLRTLFVILEYMLNYTVDRLLYKPDGSEPCYAGVVAHLLQPLLLPPPLPPPLLLPRLLIFHVFIKIMYNVK